MNRMTASAAARPKFRKLEHLDEHLVRDHIGVEAAAGHDVDDVEDLEDAMAIVIATVMSEPLIIGTMIRRKICRSLAPSSRAASSDLGRTRP